MRYESMDRIDSDAIINISEEPNPVYNVLKRTIDILGSIIGIIICLPILFTVSILIKLESRGPIIFKQKRVGQYNKVFNIYKFRSMTTNAPNKSTLEFADSHNYITKVGKFIRKTSIDELPQFFNILKGEMSFVGPRPVIEIESELLELRTEYGVDIALPGVTGWAQINGRDNISDEEKAYYDYEYTLKRSIKFDIYILIRTISKVLKSDDISR